MANKRIDQFPINTDLNGNNLLLSWANGSTVSINLSDLSEFIGENINVTSNVIETTYLDLVNAIKSNTIKQGTFYLIIDFKTCYDIPDYDQFRNPISVSIDSYAEGPVEPILVLATSTNTLAIDAYQPTYPNDKIKYDVSWNETESGKPAFGRITERIDEWNNRTDYDHRNIEFKRYQVNYYSKKNPEPGTIRLLENGEINGNDTSFRSLEVGQVIAIPNSDEVFYKISNIDSNTSMTVTGISITPFGGGGNQFYVAERASYDSYYKSNAHATDDFRLYTTFGDALDDDGATDNYIGNNSIAYLDDEIGDFLLANNVFKSGAYRNNKFGGSCYNNTFNDDCTNNTIGNRFYNNVTDDDFDDNVIGNFFRDNLITADFQNNRIGDNFGFNTITNDDFENNIIGNDFSENWLDSDYEFSFTNNRIANYCYGNTFYREFYRNHIGDEFHNNEIYQEFNNNIIGNFFEENQIGDSEDIRSGYFENNHIGRNFKGNSTRGGFGDNQIGNYFVANNIDNYFVTNIIGNGFFLNDISYNFAYNRIGHGFSQNDIDNDFGFGGGIPRGNFIGNNFDNNEIGEYFYDNTIRDYFYNNNIGDGFINNQVSYDFNNNIIGDEFQNNDIKVIAVGSIDFSASTHVYGDYNCTIFKRPDGELRLSYYDDLDELTVTNIDA
jgi:hypothetical protein